MFKELGVYPVRRLNGRHNPAPHLSLVFDEHKFAIDTSRAPGCMQPDAYLITHAHSDHHGSSAMLSPNAIASRETALALEIRHERRYAGRIFEIGEALDVCGTELRTFPTRHTIGSSAFYWENSLGVRILVTGDVKDYRSLPRCDLLVAEANYGDPWDNSCIFDDDLAGFWEALQAGSSFGAYAFGKAQRAVSLIRAMGFGEPIGMDDVSRRLTEALMPHAGPIVDFRKCEGVSVVTPSNLPYVHSSERYMLTGRRDTPWKRIRLSDHLDFRGLMRMMDHVSPEFTIFYHPSGTRSKLLAHYMRSIGSPAISIDEIDLFEKLK